MVDFKKKLGDKNLRRATSPIEIYDSLDRSTDKGELREAQKAVLTQWHKVNRNERDVIVKLHTGQGKTLIGLLILQSKLNEGAGPALYLCPDNFLADQTARQAKQFGIESLVISAKDDIPAKFLESKAILITSVQKLFNGLTKFGLNSQSIDVGAIVLDDVHACIASVRQACSIRLENTSQAYSDLLGLFSNSLQTQGSGTFADLTNKAYDAFLPVPYWDWIDRTADVAKILSRYGSTKEIKFAWPLMKDILADCDCLISGTSIEIFPRLPPLSDFGSYHKAKHRVFMSATVSDDSFLIRGMRISPETVRAPITFAEKWSGEKMVIIPSLVSEDLHRDAIISHFGKPSEKERPFGIVALSPSFKMANDWKAVGTKVAEGDAIYSEIEVLKKRNGQVPLAIVNRYDGIDLPDATCRLLVIDSKPLGESLYERYIERCLPNSDAVAVRAARTIEQGLGRSVRGDKDYSVILLIGPSLVRFLRMPESRSFLSSQTRQQIEIGIEVTEFLSEDIARGHAPIQVLKSVMNQCLSRDEGWKAFYKDKMDLIADPGISPKRLEIFSLELKAETAAQEGRYDVAADFCQTICDNFAQDDSEKGWYLQEIGRHLYRRSKLESEKMQAAAHSRNRFLLRPIARPSTKQLPFATKRVERVVDWIQRHDNAESLNISISTLLSDLRFGVDADTFESALHKLGEALGFACERPDKEWKEGPDNLWRIKDNLCLILECKSEVETTRMEIDKRETDQMNRSFAWFQKVYPNVLPHCILVIPPKKLSKSAALLHPTSVLNEKGLDKLKKNIRSFYSEFNGQDFQSLSDKHVNKALSRHGLSVDDILGSYTSALQGAGLPKG